MGVLTGLEDRIEETLDSTPWFLRLIVPEIDQGRKAILEMRQLRAEYAPEEQWYENYASSLHDFHDSLRGTADAVYDIYGALRTVPYLGSFVETQAKKVFAKAVSTKLPETFQPERQIRIPEKETVADFIESSRQMSIATLAGHATMHGMQISAERGNFNRTYAPRKEPKIREYVISFANAAGRLLEEIFWPENKNTQIYAS